MQAESHVSTCLCLIHNFFFLLWRISKCLVTLAVCSLFWTAVQRTAVTTRSDKSHIAVSCSAWLRCGVECVLCCISKPGTVICVNWTLFMCLTGLSLCSMLFWIATLFLCVCNALSYYYPIILPHYYYCYYCSISNGKLQIHVISIDVMFVMYRGCVTDWLVTANVNCMFFSPFEFSPPARLVRSASSHACIPHHYSGSLIISQLRQFEVAATSPCSCCNLCNTWATRVG